MKRLKTTVIISVFVSVTAHAVFFASSRFIVLPGMHQAVDETRRIFRLGKVEERTAGVDLFEEAGPDVRAIKMTSPLSRFEKISLQKMTLEEKPPEDLLLEEKKKIEKELFEGALPDQGKFGVEDALKAETDRAREEAAPERRSLAERIVTDTIVRRTGIEEFDDTMGITGKVEGEYVVPAVTDIREPSGMDVFQPGQKEMAMLEGKTQVGDYEDIGQSLEVLLYTYIDPRTGEKYFKLIIQARKENHLGVMPKEMIFLIDSSKSITEEKLSYVKKAVRDSLGDLNPGDRFNVVAFRGDLIRFEEEPVYADSNTVSRARSFVGQLEALGQTDVEKALLRIIRTPVSFFPSYIVLISDGRPTTGVINSRRIIQEITRQNNMQRPIFCFGGGFRVNRYLLDFISYQNRAWSRFAATTYDVAREFGRFFRQIKDPVLLNVRYGLKGLDGEEVYPKSLPDFYRGQPFTLYGRFDDEDIFSMRLLGEINGTTKEFIFRESLNEAEKGDESIAAEWAFRKIYYLISRITMGMGDPARQRAEINTLSRKYGITTPYDLGD